MRQPASCCFVGSWHARAAPGDSGVPGVAVALSVLNASHAACRASVRARRVRSSSTAALHGLVAPMGRRLDMAGRYDPPSYHAGRNPVPGPEWTLADLPRALALDSLRPLAPISAQSAGGIRQSEPAEHLMDKVAK